MATTKKANTKKAPIIAIISVIVLILAIVITACNFYGKDNNFYKSTYPREYSSYVTKASKEFGVDETLIYAIIRTESGFDPKAGSEVGAKGLMQLMPDTFTWLQNMYSMGDKELSTEDLYDPEINIMYGTYFLSWLLDRYEKENSAVAAYNAGFGAVDGWLENVDICPDGKNLENIPYKETANYVVKVENAKGEYKKLYY